MKIYVLLLLSMCVRHLTTTEGQERGKQEALSTIGSDLDDNPSAPSPFIFTVSVSRDIELTHYRKGARSSRYCGLVFSWSLEMLGGISY